MDSFWQHSTKYDGSLHYRYPVRVVEKLEGRLITYCGPGDLVKGYRGSWVREDHVLSFFWRQRPFVLHVLWNRGWEPEKLYVDIATGTNWNEETVEYVDMDLDLILRHGTTVVELDDEDEFEEHRTRWNYPEELVEGCWKAVEEVRRLLEAGREPFAVSMFAWRPGAVVHMEYRHAQIQDATLLAGLNQQLIIDEGHRNPMSLDALEQRMSAWLADGYSAVIFIHGGKPAGYALYRSEADHVYLRQFFICRDVRRKGIGRAALNWLRENVWAEAPRIRLDVLVGNSTGLAFWRAVGFTDYCLTMELAGKSAE